MSEQEINVLRAEILQYYTEISAYNCVLYTVIAALLAYAISSDNYLLCLLPYCVMFPIHFMCETKREAICRIGAYLSVFSGSNYQWERRIHDLDKKRWGPLIKNNKKEKAVQSTKTTENNEKNQKNESRIKKNLKRDTMYFQFYLISLLSSAAAVYKVSIYGYSSNGVAIRTLAIILITVVSLIVIRKTIVFVPTLRQEYIEGWEKVREEESPSAITERKNDASKPGGK